MVTTVVWGGSSPVIRSVIAQTFGVSPAAITQSLRTKSLKQDIIGRITYLLTNGIVSRNRIFKRATCLRQRILSICRIRRRQAELKYGKRGRRMLEFNPKVLLQLLDKVLEMLKVKKKSETEVYHGHTMVEKSEVQKRVLSVFGLDKSRLKVGKLLRALENYFRLPDRELTDREVEKALRDRWIDATTVDFSDTARLRELVDMVFNSPDIYELPNGWDDF